MLGSLRTHPPPSILSRSRLGEGERESCCFTTVGSFAGLPWSDVGAHTSWSDLGPTDYPGALPPGQIIRTNNNKSNEFLALSNVTSPSLTVPFILWPPPPPGSRLCRCQGMDEGRLAPELVAYARHLTCFSRSSTIPSFSSLQRLYCRSHLARPSSARYPVPCHIGSMPPRRGASPGRSNL